jgi:hypothetical protein
MMKILLVALALAVVASAAPVNSPPTTCMGTVTDGNIPNAPNYVNGSLTNTGVHLYFQASPRFASVAFAFQSTGNDVGYCAYTTGNASPHWAYTADDAACGTLADIKVTFPTVALGNCFAFDNTTDPKYVLYSTTVRVTSTINRPSIRGDSITRTIVTAFRLSYRFQRYINITASLINATERAQIQSDIVRRIFNPVDRTLTIVLLTSVQNPYELIPHPYRGMTYDLTDGGKIFNVTSAPTLVGAPAGYPSAECDGFSICTQYWQAVFIPPEDSCTWSPTFTFHFYTKCSYIYTEILGNPCNDTNANYTATYQLATDNFCVQVVQDITLSGTLKPYNTYPNVQATPTNFNFLYNQVVYFRADIAASPAGTVEIDYTEFMSAVINSAGHTLPLTPLSVLTGASYNFNYYNNIVGTYTSGFSLTVNTDSIKTSEIDAVQTIGVSALFRVAYRNLNVNSRSRSLYKFAHVVLADTSFDVLADAGSASAALSAEFTVSRPLTATTSTNSLVPAVAASAAGVALLSMFVAFVLYKRRTTQIVKTHRTPPESKEESTNSA